VEGGIECDHFFRQRVRACKDCGKRVGNRHQGHGNNS
jgi:hypothetical protein